MVTFVSIELESVDSVLLQEFVKVKELQSEGRLLSLTQCLSNVVVPSFIESIVKPELNPELIVPEKSPSEVRAEVTQSVVDDINNSLYEEVVDDE